MKNFLKMALECVERDCQIHGNYHGFDNSILSNNLISNINNLWVFTHKQDIGCPALNSYLDIYKSYILNNLYLLKNVDKELKKHIKSEFIYSDTDSLILWDNFFVKSPTKWQKFLMELNKNKKVLYRKYNVGAGVWSDWTPRLFHQIEYMGEWNKKQKNAYWYKKTSRHYLHRYGIVVKGADKLNPPFE